VRVRLLSYNIHKCIGGIDRRYEPKRVLETIGHYSPDIVMLQEVDDGCKRSLRHRQVDLLGDKLGLRHRAWFPNVRTGCGGDYGNAILSRFPLTEAVNVDLSVPLKKRRSVIHARCTLKNQTFHIANMHLGLFGPERKAQIRKFLSRVTELDDDDPMVVAGDLNDVWHTLGPKMLAPAGFSSVHRPLRTFPAYAPVRALDGFYVRGNARLVSMQRSRLEVAKRASDHLPLIGEIEIL